MSTCLITKKSNKNVSKKRRSEKTHFKSKKYIKYMLYIRRYSMYNWVFCTSVHIVEALILRTI